MSNESNAMRIESVFLPTDFKVKRFKSGRKSFFAYYWFRACEVTGERLHIICTDLAGNLDKHVCPPNGTCSR